jgi:hypothetical protein
MQQDTLKRRGYNYKGKIYIKNTINNSCGIRKPSVKSDQDPETTKIIPDPQH